MPDPPILTSRDRHRHGGITPPQSKGFRPYRNRKKLSTLLIRFILGKVDTYGTNLLSYLQLCTGNRYDVPLFLSLESTSAGGFFVSETLYCKYHRNIRPIIKLLFLDVKNKLIQFYYFLLISYTQEVAMEEKETVLSPAFPAKSRAVASARRNQQFVGRRSGNCCFLPGCFY